MTPRKPDFFILGAPKCGTTSLDTWLQSHPHIFLAEKEAHYFNTDHKNRKTTSSPDYLALFENASEEHLAVGETSVRYLYSDEAVTNILRYNNDARFIVLLRNPVEMVYSWHNQVCFSGLEDVRDFETAWELQSERRAGQRIPAGCREAKMLLYGEICLLGKQLQRLYEQCLPNRVHVVLFDDLRDDPDTTYRGVLDFLHVPTDHKPDFVTCNRAKDYYFRALNPIIFGLGKLRTILRIKKSFGVLEWLRKKNGREKTRIPMAPQIKEMLSQYFCADIKLLEKMIDRDLTHWR